MLHVRDSAYGRGRHDLALRPMRHLPQFSRLSTHQVQVMRCPACGDLRVASHPARAVSPTIQCSLRSVAFWRLLRATRASK